MFINKSQLSFACIVFLALIFRTTNLAYIEFKADEAVALILASRPVFGHPLPPFATASSLGILNPPLFTYFIFPLTLITLDPKIISLYIGIINSLAIGFLFLIVKRYYGLAIALIASILLSFSPWSIIFSRKIWVPDFILPFTVLLIFSIHKIIIEKKVKYWTLFGACGLFLLQLHQSSIFFLFFLILFLHITKTKINLRYLLRGILIGVIPAIPYIFYEISNNCPDCYAFFSAHGKLSFKYAFGAFIRPMQLLAQGDYHFLFGQDTLTFAQNFPLAYKLRTVFYAEYLLLPLGIFLFWKRFTNLRFLVYTTIALPFSYFILRVEAFMHYFIILTPLLFIYVSLALKFLLTSTKNYIRTASIVLFVAIIFSSIIVNLSFFDLLKIKKTLNGDYGNTYAANEPIIKGIRKKYNYSKEAEEVILTTYIQKTTLRGNSYLAKLLYSYSETKKRLLLLEKKLVSDPNDIRVQNELIAFYTATVPNIETIKLLYEKTKKIPGYEPVYQEAYDYYLDENFLKLAFVDGLRVKFDIPAHWESKEQTLDKIIITGDGFTIELKRIKEANVGLIKKSKEKDKTYNVDKVVVLKQNVIKTTCIYKNMYWCGSWYSPLRFGSFEYQIIYKKDNNELMEIKDTKLKGGLNVMDRIILSFR